jgi:hypothetical protein
MRAVVELVVNLDIFANEKNYPTEHLLNIALMSREYDDHEPYRRTILNEALRCFRANEWASPIIIYGLANALGISIQQIHPIEMARGRSYTILNSLINPFILLPRGKIFILWSNSENTNINEGFWRSNHFVSCLEIGEEIPKVF